MRRAAASLPARIALRLGLVAVAVSLLQTLWAVAGERERGAAALRQRAERAAARLAVSLQSPLYSFDAATASDVVAAELAAREVVAVRVEGSGLSRTWRGETGVPVAADALPSAPELVAAAATVMEPPAVPSPRPLATVTAVLSPHLLRAEWRALVWRRALETLALLATIGLASWAVLHRNVVRPLELIRAAMVSARQALSSVPGGDLPARDPVAGLPGAFPELRAMGRRLPAAGRGGAGEPRRAGHARGRPARHPRLHRRRGGHRRPGGAGCWP